MKPATPQSTTGRAGLSLVSQAIDCGILIGQDGSNSFEFPTAAEAVAQRGRLGISRGFIGSLTAETLSPLAAARELEAFCRSKIARKTFFPTFTVQGGELFAGRATEEFSDIIGKSSACLFRLCGGKEEILRSGLRFLAEHVVDRPVVAALRVSEAPSVSALVDLARRYPQINFLLTDYAWGSYGFVQMAMEEAENILSDTSLVHGADHIAMLVARHGANRILFSLGYRALGGAALGSVLGARISQKEKEAILFGNITSLLKLPELAKPARASIEPGEWKSFLETGAPTLPAIDCHGHLGPAAMWTLSEQEEAVQTPRKLAEMKAQRLRYFIFSGTRALFGNTLEGNALVERQVSKSDDPRLLAYFVYNPHYAASLEPFLAKVPRSKVFIGFKILCDYWKVRVDDPAFVPMWTIADRYRLPVLIHTWEGPWNSPSMLAPIAEAYPEARLLLAHVGGSGEGRKQAEALAKAHRNVFLEWCGSFFSRKPWEDTVREVGPHKLLFGTDAVLHSHDWELARLISLPLSREDFRRILHDNMMGILAPLLDEKDLPLICQGNGKPLFKRAVYS